MDQSCGAPLCSDMDPDIHIGYCLNGLALSLSRSLSALICCLDHDNVRWVPRGKLFTWTCLHLHSSTGVDTRVLNPTLVPNARRGKVRFD